MAGGNVEVFIARLKSYSFFRFVAGVKLAVILMLGLSAAVAYGTIPSLQIL
jgi:hypothetical protein